MERLENLVGQVLDNRYRLEHVKGAGGTAVVFLAEDTLLSRPVAIKMLRSVAARPAGGEKDEEARRINRHAFRQEAMAASVLSHPNTVAIYDVSPAMENPYIVMEYIEGESLADRVKREGALQTAEVVRITAAVLSALSEAHEQGIIHRDIKAQNILLSSDGQVKVTDFGIACIDGTEGLSLPGRVIGTVDTISPEQASGGEIDARSDLYSLGILMYQMATGALPFTGDPETVAFMQVNEKPKYPSTLNPAIPAGVEDMILIALEKDARDRFPSATAMQAALRRVAKAPDRPLRRIRGGGPAVSRFLMKHGTPLFVGIGVLVAALCVYAVITFARVQPLPSVTVVELPAFTVYTDDASLALDARILIEVEYVYRPDLAEGTVLSQYPAAGARLKLDGENDRETLTLQVSTKKTG